MMIVRKVHGGSSANHSCRPRRGSTTILVGCWITVAVWSSLIHIHGWIPPLNIAQTRSSTGRTWSRQQDQGHFHHLHAAPAAVDTLIPSNKEEEEKQKKQQQQNQQQDLLDDFVDFLLTKQMEIIQKLEDLEAEYTIKPSTTSTATATIPDPKPALFSRDTWGIFDEEKEEDDDGGPNVRGQKKRNDDKSPGAGGITRVIQGGQVIEKGACSFTLIGQGILSKERAATIRARQQHQQQNQPSQPTTQESGNSSVREDDIQEGDCYSAAALSMVLHSRSPHVPTFRSDVRVFFVHQTRHLNKQHHPNSNKKNVETTTTSDATTAAATESSSSTATTTTTVAWFGGGADLTPYYLIPEDITFFHQRYADLCQRHWSNNNHNDDDSSQLKYSYDSMKKACDDYFYLPARQEHRGTGGIFFDDMTMTPTSLAFCQDVVESWMPSWIPLVQRRQLVPITSKQRQWQLLRRGRYLEFNLLYDRGVRFGLANANPRVEGVMVSAPPLVAFEYNHKIEPNSPEAELINVLKTPKEWL